MKTTTDAAPPAGDDQSTLWNGSAGRAWIEAQSLLDAMFEPFETLLVEAVCAASASRVLDVGCGTGGTTLAIARRLAAKGRCVGVDISEPMIAAARARARHEDAAVDFICADAQRHGFETAAFDMIVSRFGVMFFDDPVAAFANLRRAARADARLQCIAWRSPAENPFMTTAERAAAPLLPQLPARDPDAPGQFAFADRRCVERTLEQSSWCDIDIRPIDIACSFPATELVRYFTQLGPLGRVLPQADEPTRARIIEAVRTAFDPYVLGDEVRFNAACWTIGARAGSRADKDEGVST